MISKIIPNRMTRFLIGGGVAAAFNLFLMFLLVDHLGFNTSLLRNFANAISIELSLILSFFIYRLWVWPGGNWNLKGILIRQLPLFNLSAGSAIIIRIFLLFPILDWIGIKYTVNTLLGIIIGATVNYVLSDNLIFRKDDATTPELYYPEGLASAFQDESLGDNRASWLSAPLKFVVNKPLTLSILIPAHNEEGCIEKTIRSMCEILDRNSISYEVLVINDHSQDKTEVLLSQLSSANERVRHINNYLPHGFGFAIRCGLENYKCDAVAIVMADGSDEPEDLIKYYYKLLEGYACVFGSRFIEGGGVRGYPLHKLVINRMGNLFIQALFKLRYNDTTNAFKAYRREVIEGISPLVSHHFNLTVEMPLKSISRGYSYAIVPIRWRNRKTGISKLKIKEVWGRYLFIIFNVFIEMLLSGHVHDYKNMADKRRESNL